MAARQQYHDEAFERQDTEIKRIHEAEQDAENIRGLVRIPIVSFLCSCVMPRRVIGRISRSTFGRMRPMAVLLV